MAQRIAMPTIAQDPTSVVVMTETFAAFRALTEGDAVDRGVVPMAVDELPVDGVLVEVHWSSVN